MRKLALLLTVLCAALGIGLYAAGSSGLLPSLWGSPDPSHADSPLSRASSVTELPFETTTINDGVFASDTKWYKVKIRSSRYWTFNKEYEEVALPTSDNIDASRLWCFTGSADEGISIYNMAAGPAAPLYVPNYNNDTKAVFNRMSEPTLWLLQQGANGYVFTPKDDPNPNWAYLNDVDKFGGNDHRLAFWRNSTTAADDGGSSVEFIEVEATAVPEVPRAKCPTLPFEPTTITDGEFAEDTKWYNIKMKQTNSYLYDNAGDEAILLNSDHQSSEKARNNAHLWCFTYDPSSGVTIYNRQAGPSRKFASATLGSDATTYPGLLEPGSSNTVYAWDIVTSNVESNYYCVKQHGSARAYLNNRGSKLAYWNTDYSLDSDGSAIQFIEANPLPFETTTITNGKFAPGTHWYRMQIRPDDTTPEGRAITNIPASQGQLSCLTISADYNSSNDSEALWCLVNDGDGYKLYNRASGASQGLTRDSSDGISLTEPPTLWDITQFEGTLPDNKTGWLIKAQGTDSYMHNHNGHNSDIVRTWNSSGAADDAGSAILFIEADPLPFEPTTIENGEFAADTHWYWMTVEDRYLTNTPGGTGNFNGFELAGDKSDPVVNGEAWCFVKTDGGYRICNRAEGATKALSTANGSNNAISEFVDIDADASDANWILEKFISRPGYYLLKNNAGGYMQNFGHQSDLGVWSAVEDHSRVKFIEIPADQLPDASDEGPETVEMTFTNRKQGSPNSGNASDWTSYTDANAPANTYDEAGKHPYELIFTSDVNEAGRGINQYTRNDDGTGSGGDTNPKHIRHAFRHCTITLSTSAEGYYVKSAVMKLRPGDNSKTITVTADGQNHSLSGSQFNELTFNGTPDQPIALTFGNQDWAVLYSCTVELAKKGSAAKPTSIIIDDANVEGYAWSAGNNTESGDFRDWTATVNTVPVTIKYTAEAGAGGNQKFGAMDSEDGKKGFVICGEYTLELPEQYKIKSAKFTFKRVSGGTPTLQFPLNVARKNANENVQEGTESTYRAYMSTGDSDDDTWAKFTWDTPVNSFSFNTENSKKRILVKSIELIFADESGTEPDPGIVENVYNMEFYSRAQGSPASGGANSWTSNVDTEHPVAISLSSSASDGINQYTRKDDGTQGDGAVGRIAIKNTTITFGTPAMGGYVRSLTMRVRGGEAAATTITVNGTQYSLSQGAFYDIEATGTASDPITITADNADWTVIYGMNVEVVVPTQAVPDEPEGEFISPWVSIHIRKGQGNVINGVVSGVTTIGRSTNGNNPATNYTPQAYTEEWKIAGNATEGFKLVNRQFPTLVLATRNDNNNEQIVELKADGEDANYIYRWDIEPSGDGSYFAINPHGNGKYLNSRGTAGQQLKFWSLDDGGKLRFLTADGVWEPFIAESYRETLKDYLDDIACFGAIADVPGEYADVAAAIEAGKAAIDDADPTQEAIDAAALPFFEMIVDQPFTLENVSVPGLFLNADVTRNRLYRSDGSDYTSIFTLKIDPNTLGRYNLYNPLSGKTVKACQANNNPWYLDAEYLNASFKLYSTEAGAVGLQQPIGGNASFIHWGASLGGVTRWTFYESPGSQWNLASANLDADAVAAFEYIREIEAFMDKQPWSAFRLDELRTNILTAIENGNSSNVSNIYRAGISAIEADIVAKAAGEKVNILYENNGQWLTTISDVPTTTTTEHIGDEVTPGTVWTLEPAADNTLRLVDGNGKYIVTLPTEGATPAATTNADDAAAFRILLKDGNVLLDPVGSQTLDRNNTWIIRLNQGALVKPVSSFHNMEGQTPRLYYIRNVAKMAAAEEAQRRSYLTGSGATNGSALQLWLEPQGGSFWVVQDDSNDRSKIYNAYWHETHIGSVSAVTTDEADGYYYIIENHLTGDAHNAGLYISQNPTTEQAGGYCLDRGGFRANDLEHTYTCDLLSGGYSPRAGDYQGTAWIFVPVTEKMELDFIRRSEQERSDKAKEMVEYFRSVNPWCDEVFENAYQNFGMYTSAPGYTPQNARKFSEHFSTLASDFSDAVLNELPGKQFELFSRSHIDAGPLVMSARVGVTDNGTTLGIVDREKRDCDAFTFVPSNEAGWFYIVNGEGKFVGSNGWRQMVSNESSAGKYTVELRWTLNNGAPTDYWTCIRQKNGQYLRVSLPEGHWTGGNYVEDPVYVGDRANNNNNETGFEFFPWTPDVTGIETVDPDNMGEGFEGMYNLQGIRVNPEGAAPGIYIVRRAGKAMKVFVR